MKHQNTEISKSAKEYKQRLSPDGSQTQFGSQLKVCIENSSPFLIIWAVQIKYRENGLIMVVNGTAFA